MPDPTSRIRFNSVFPKKAWIILRKTDPDPIWMVWSGFGQTLLVWKLVCRNHRARCLAGRSHFPTFRLGSVLPQTSRIILCKNSADPIQFWRIVSGFGQTDPVRKQAGAQESSGQCFPADPDRMRIGSGMFFGERTIRVGEPRAATSTFTRTAPELCRQKHHAA